jgi:hypothetical protein
VLSVAPAKFPALIQSFLESLCEELLNKAKDAIQEKTFSHAAFKNERTRIRRDARGRIKKGSNRIAIKYKGSVSRNLIDQGGLWNSLSRGGKSNVLKFNGASKTFRLTVGSDVKYAKYIHDGYKIKRNHWVPGIVDSNGIFRYKRGVKTGIMARARTFAGVKFIEVALDDIKPLFPKKFEAMLDDFWKGHTGG